MKTTLSLLLLIGMEVCALANDVDVERFFCLYGGMAQTRRGTLDWESEYIPLIGSGSRYTGGIDYEQNDAAVFGLRIGRWMDCFGVAMDVSYFNMDSENAALDIDIIPISLLFLGRYSLLVSNDFPAGKLQPYLAIGPTFPSISTSAKTQAADDTPIKLSDWQLGIGLDVRLGCAWQQHEKPGFFIEYRYTSIKASSDAGEDGAFLWGQTDGIKATLSTHHILAGVSFYY